MIPLRLAFAIRLVYDQLPSRVNLQKPNAGSIAEPSYLHHVLSNCTYALADGRYTWRHNQVLREVCEAARAAVSKTNSRTIANQRKIYFLHEGLSHLCKMRSNAQDTLVEAKDWIVAANIEGMRHNPRDADRKWQEAGRPEAGHGTWEDSVTANRIDNVDISINWPMIVRSRKAIRGLEVDSG